MECQQNSSQESEIRELGKKVELHQPFFLTCFIFIALELPDFCPVNIDKQFKTYQKMEQSLNEIFAAKNEMVRKGQIVEATEKYFASNAKTIDFDGTVTNDKSEMVQKMHGFAGAIAKVNGISLHNASLNGNVSFAEFTFDFDMKDGSNILWHEILRTVWQNGQIVEEQYFKA